MKVTLRMRLGILAWRVGRIPCQIFGHHWQPATYAGVDVRECRRCMTVTYELTADWPDLPISRNMQRFRT